MGNLVGPSCIIEGDFGSVGARNLEAVLFADGQLHHLFAIGPDWRRAQTLPGPAAGPGSIIQSDFSSGDHGNFEVVLWTGNELVHYFHDNSDVSLPWRRAQTISTRATGPGCIIQSDFRSADHGNRCRSAHVTASPGKSSRESSRTRLCGRNESSSSIVS
jgi:hypothetical protein